MKQLWHQIASGLMCWKYVWLRLMRLPHVPQFFGGGSKRRMCDALHTWHCSSGAGPATTEPLGTGVRPMSSAVLRRCSSICGTEKVSSSDAPRFFCRGARA